MEIIYKDIDERFDNPIFRKYALSVVKEKEIVLKDRFQNLQKVNLILEISMIGDHKTLQSENKYLWTENETVLNLRVIYLGYIDNEKPDTLEFTRRIKELIEIVF